MENLLEQITHTRTQINSMHTILEMLNTKLAQQSALLQHMCKHSSYIAEDNGDLHNYKYVYTCECCKFTTTAKPENKTIIYL